MAFFMSKDRACSSLAPKPPQEDEFRRILNTNTVKESVNGHMEMGAGHAFIVLVPVHLDHVSLDKHGTGVPSS